ncbi:MAG: hypothetical protein O7C75_07545 [Verrucomicrobia bacterium]|nr:hypothetical protein [Verrucomicrobiota bacterium]
MSAKKDIDPRSIDPRIRKELIFAARQLKDNKVNRAGARRWLIASGLALVILGLRIVFGEFSGLAFPAICALAVLTLFLNYLGNLRTPLDYLEASREVEKKFPEVEGLLSTAMEQKRDAAGYNFLQEKLIKSTLHFSMFQYWEDAGKEARLPARVTYLASIALLLGVAAATYYAKDREISITAPSLPILISSVEVTPGDTEVERGSAVVIAARFNGDLARSATLVLQQDDGTTLRHAMARSLSDPVYAYTLASVEESALYFIQYPGKETKSYRLDVYDLPALVQADAFLDYPDYTGIRDRLIKDTRRISAVEGTRLDYQFLVNKPLATAELIDKEGNRIQLSPTNPEKSKFGTEITLTEPLRYHLHLTDEQGRKNAFPPDVRIAVRNNKRPELRLNFPKGDQAVSPIEELTLEAKANDDFGLIDYGLAVALGAESPEYVSLQTTDPDQLEAEFDKLYALEEEAVEVDQLVTWFAWADDFSADGKIRRTLSDLYFAEVRSLEEIYREGEGGGGGQGQGQQGGPEGELLDQQRQIAIATFKLKQRGTGDSSFLEDSAVIHESQQQIRLLLEQVKMELEEEKLINAANLAGEFMDKAIVELAKANDENSADPLEAAWLATQGAYQALLSMRPREMQVSQSRRGGGEGGGNNRNQRQLNQLEFKDEENRYETESQAQAMTTPEEREQLEILSKLSELARRQQQVNERLRELQTALAAAEDKEERDKIERELKRLEEEQRRMLTQMDEVQQRMDNMPQNQESRETREQLAETREDMRRIGENLQEGEVSKALAAGSRAQQNLEALKEEFREKTASQFSEAMEQARDAARELAENQRKISEQLEALENDQAPRLDGSGEREGVSERYREQREGLKNLMDDLRQITEDSETGEPTLNRKLYDILRRQNQSEASETLEVAEELVRRGFLDQAQQMQPGLQEEFNELERAISEAADSVMGDQTTTLRFAQEELDDLMDQLEQERPEGELANNSGSQPGQQGQQGQQGQEGQQPGQGQSKEPSDQQSPSQGQQPVGQQGGSLAQNDSQDGQPSNTSGQPTQRGRQTGGGGGFGGNDLRDLEDIIRSFSDYRGPGGPITGGEFLDWNERLRTIEELMELPEARQRMQDAREQAERMRAEFKRHGTPPRWEDIDTSVMQPIREVESWVKQELLRREQPDTLQPIDRDPVPPKYANSVKKYYEALGGDS